MKTSVQLVDKVFSDWGLTVSTSKTKVLVVGRNAEAEVASLDLHVRGVAIEAVHKFKYLGSMFTSDGKLDSEISHRVANASAAWHSLKRHVWSSKYLTLARKVLIFKTVVLSVLLYGCETWPALKSHINRLEVFQMNCLRFLCGFTWRDKRSNDSVRATCKLSSLDEVITHRRLRWLGHTARMSHDRLPFQCMFGQLQGVKPRGKPRDSWQTLAYKDLSTLHVQFKWFRLAKDRTGWRQLIAPVRT